MNVITQLPEKKGIIGSKEIAKAAKAGKIKRVIIANNCPDFLLNILKDEKLIIEKFDGNQKLLGTKLGKPFAVAMAGYDE